MKVLDPEGYFVVVIDILGEGLGGILMQNYQMIAYDFKKLKNYEKCFASHNLEFAVIVHALQMWQHYLMQNPFELWFDHQGLNYIFTQSNLNT